MPPGIARVVMSGTQGSSIWANVFHVKCTLGANPSIANWHSCIGDFANAYINELFAVVSNECTVNEASGTLMTGAETELRDVSGFSYTGGNAFPAESGQVCYLINWNTYAAWRGGKPRTYLPGAPEASVGRDGGIAGATLASLNGHITAFISAVEGISHGDITIDEFGFLSYVHNKEWREPPMFWKIPAGSCNGFAATQRRRIRR